MSNQVIKAIVTDIEGTTSALSFVKETLFPYAYKNLPDYILDHEKELAALLDAVREEERNRDLSLEEVIQVLLRYIDEDQKVTPLKTLQGMIWKEGYESGALIGHVYDDALAGLRRWDKQGVKIYVYSSGSISAQKLLFSNSEAGDLTPLFSGYFDTTTGSKQDKKSYEKIIQDIGFLAHEILFLSDSTDEIEAADAAGMNVIILDRENALIKADNDQAIAHNFDQILKETVEA